MSEWGILPSRPPGPEPGALLSELHSVKSGVANETSNSYLLVHSQSCNLYTMATVVGTVGVGPFVCRLSSGCTEPLCYVPSSPPFLTTQGEGAIKLASLVIPFGDGISRGDRNRICDLMLPKHALCHLSYTPWSSGGEDRTPVSRFKARRPAIERRRNGSGGKNRTFTNWFQRPAP